MLPHLPRGDVVERGHAQHNPHGGKQADHDGDCTDARGAELLVHVHVQCDIERERHECHDELQCGDRQCRTVSETPAPPGTCATMIALRPQDIALAWVIQPVLGKAAVIFRLT